MKIFKTAKWKDKTKGGLADKGKPEDFDQEQLRKGILTEKEHTKDKDLAEEIAMDHLEESGDKKGEKGGKYYDKLDEMEKKVEKDKEASIFFDLMKTAKADAWPKKLKKGRFTEYCKKNGFKGPCKACADKALKSSDASVRGMASFYLNTTLKRKKSNTNRNVKIADMPS